MIAAMNMSQFEERVSEGAGVWEQREVGGGVGVGGSVLNPPALPPHPPPAPPRSPRLGVQNGGQWHPVALGSQISRARVRGGGWWWGLDVRPPAAVPPVPSSCLSSARLASYLTSPRLDPTAAVSRLSSCSSSSYLYCRQSRPLTPLSRVFALS